MTELKGGEDPCREPPKETTLTLNVNNNSIYEYKNLVVKDVLKWTNDNGILPLPCQNATKKPFVEISEPVLKTEGVFHIPTPMRVDIIKDIWNNVDEVIKNKSGLNIAIDTNCGWNSGKNFSFIDIDSDLYVSYFKFHFPTCPVVYGSHGCKFMFFLENKPKTNSYNIIDEDNSHIGEFYSSGTNRLCLIYGKHPKTLTNPDKPVIYKLDLTNYTIPTFGNEFTEKFNNCLINGNLTLENTENTNIDNKVHVTPDIKNKRNTNARNLTEFVGITLDRLIYSTQNIIIDGNIATGSPFHSSKGNVCFRSDMNKGMWHCFQCGSGGGPLEYLAVQYGIVSCSDCRGNILKDETVRRKLIGKLIKEGYITEQEWVNYKNSYKGGK